MSSVTYKKYGPLILTSFCGILMVVELFINPKVVPQVKTVADGVREIVTTINLLAVFVAIIVLIQNNYAKTKRSGTLMERFLAYEMIALLGISSVIAMYFGTTSDVYARYIEYTLTAATVSTNTSTFWQLYAGYRALRFKTIDGAALLIASIIAVVGLSPWGKLFIPGAQATYQWSVDSIVTSSSSGMMVGAALGGVAASIRTLAGRETMFNRRD